MRRAIPFVMVALCVATPALGQNANLPALAPGESLLQLEAVGEIVPVAETAVGVGVSGHAPSGAGALAAARAAADRVLAVARRNGLRADDVEVRYAIAPALPGTVEEPGAAAKPNEYKSYAPQRTAAAELLIHARDAARAKAVFDQVVAAGCDRIGGPFPEAAPAATAYEAGRIRALAFARAQADAYAAASGMRVSRLLRIDERDGGAAAGTGAQTEAIRALLAAQQSGAQANVSGPPKRVRLSVDFAIVAR